MGGIGVAAAVLLNLPATAATLVIRVEGADPAKGPVYAGVCATSFEEQDCPYRDRAAPRGASVQMRLRNVRPGRYAIAVFQDENGNGRLDRPFFVPTEPFGFSNDVGRSGPPSFEGALIEVREPSTTVSISLR